MSLAKQLLEYPAFRNEAEFLSNFSLYRFSERLVRDGITYWNNETFYQSQKFKERWRQREVSNLTAAAAKRYAKDHAHLVRKDFNKLDVMWEGLCWKFNQPRFANLLRSTGDLELVERNTWNDTFWGVNIKGEGENNLGKLLMKIRNEFC